MCTVAFFDIDVGKEMLNVVSDAVVFAVLGVVLNRGIIPNFPSPSFVVGEGFIADLSIFKFSFRSFISFFMPLHEDAMDAISFDSVLADAFHELQVLCVSVAHTLSDTHHLLSM